MCGHMIQQQKQLRPVDLGQKLCMIFITRRFYIISDKLATAAAVSVSDKMIDNKKNCPQTNKVSVLRYFSIAFVQKSFYSFC